MSFEDGPYVQFACFCEMVLEDKTNTYSLIRIIDTITQTAAGANPPEDMPPLSASLKLAIGLKSGKARGRYNLKITPELPNGSTLESSILSIDFEGEEKGCTVFTTMNILFKLEGLYWFYVDLSEEKITAIPFRIKYQRIVSGPPQPG